MPLRTAIEEVPGEAAANGKRGAKLATGVFGTKLLFEPRLGAEHPKFKVVFTDMKHWPQVLLLTCGEPVVGTVFRRARKSDKRKR